VEVQDWWSGGELVPLGLSGTEQGVFVRREGSGPSNVENLFNARIRAIRYDG
jgi:hypothetical protein